MLSLIFIIFSLIGVFLQLTTLSEISFWGTSPNLVLAIVLAGAILSQKSKLFWIVFFPVLWLDFLSGQPIGLMSLSFWIVFLFIFYLAGWQMKKNDLLARILLSLVGVSFFEASQILLVKLANFLSLAPDLSFDGRFFCLKLFISLLLNGGLTLFLLWIFNRYRSLFPAEY